MQTLGELLGTARRSAGDFQRWLQVADPDCAHAVARAAEQLVVTPAGFARLAVADFSHYADEAAWSALTAELRQSDDPGLACLQRMVHWRLTAFDCGRHTSTLSSTQPLP